MSDETELSPAERRRYLERDIRHQRLLVSDALACGLAELYEKRRARLRALREQLAALDAQTAGGSRKRA